MILSPLGLLSEKPPLQNTLVFKWWEYVTEVNGQKQDSKLDILFSELEDRNSKHPAVIAYNKVMRGAADTVRSIIISANSRLSSVNEDLLRLMDSDEMNINELGAGVNYDGKTKTVIFCVIPDNDKTYSFIVGLFYTQIFQQLYFYADFMSGKRSLPIHVTMLLDEFANVSLPDSFLSDLSTMRSRNISAIIIIQNFAQIKSMYKDNKWEEIPGNCDTLLYLGGNEQSTHEYFSKTLGEGTYDKKTYGETKGRNGSSSQNFDRYGRKLLTESEVREIDNSECLIFVRGQHPIKDKKFDTFNHPLWARVANANFVFDASKEREEKFKASNTKSVSDASDESSDIGSVMSTANNASYEFIPRAQFEALKKKEDYENELKSEDEKVHRCFEFTAEEFLAIDVDSIDFSSKNKNLFDKKMLEENAKRFAAEKAEAEEIENLERARFEYAEDIMALRKAGYSNEQVDVFLPLFKYGHTSKDIIEKFTPNMEPDELNLYIEAFSQKEEIKETETVEAEELVEEQVIEERTDEDEEDEYI